MSSITRMDIVDIELNSGNVHRSWLNHSIGSGDNNANAFGVRLFRNSEPVDIGAGWVQGFFRNSQGQNIALTENGVIDGNVTYVTLPQACYNYEGQFTLAIKLVSPGFTSTVTMRIVDGIVDNTNTGGAVAPTGTVPTYQEILAVYNQLLADVEDYEEVVANQDQKIDDLKSALDDECAIVDQITTVGNLYDYTRRVTDIIINSNGSGSIEEGFDTSGYIPVKPNTYYQAKIWSPTSQNWYTPSIGRINYYDSGHNRLSTDTSANLSSGESLSPAGAAYARFSIDNTRTAYADYPSQYRYAVFTETNDFPETYYEFNAVINIPQLVPVKHIVDNINETTKNLFYFTDPTDFTKNGVTVQFLDRSTIKVYGTATSTFTLPISIPHLDAGIYTFLREFLTPPSARNPHLKINGTNADDGTFTIAATDTITLELTRNNLLNTTVRCMVVPGSTMIPYVQGGLSAFDAVARADLERLSNAVHENENTEAGIDAADDIFSTVDALNDVSTANICFLTDTHDTDDAMTDFISCFNELNNRGFMDMCIHGGDFVDNDAATTKETAMNQLKSAKKIMGRLNIPYIGLLGNHDQNVRDYDETTNYIKRSELAFQFFNPMNKIIQGPLMTGYFDMPRVKIRVICLNTSDLPVGNDGYYSVQPLSTFIVSQEQLDWIANEALNIPKGYAVAFFAHTMPTEEVALDWGLSKYSAIMDGDVLWAMLTARKNKTSYQKNDPKSYTILQRDENGDTIYVSYTMPFSCDYDFSGYENIEYIGWFNGHTHHDYLSSTDLMYICATTLAGTKTSQSASIDTVSADVITINTDTKTVNLTRIGVGSDRSFSYGT